MADGAPYTVLGQSGAIGDVLDDARCVSATDCKVLLTGERGVGKGLLAQFIHGNSPRRQHKMLSRRCAGVAQSRLESELFEGGLFEQAGGSTLMLVDIDEMGPRTQTRLLHVLENGEDVRIISATSRDLLRRTSEPAFSVDLYYRLNVAHLQIPALRERREDIAFLMRYYLKILSEEFQLPPCELDSSAWSALEAYSWPGNIRELHDVAQLLAVTHAGCLVGVEQLPEAVLAYRSPMSTADAAPVSTSLQPYDCQPRTQGLRAATGEADRGTTIPHRRAV